MRMNNFSQKMMKIESKEIQKLKDREKLKLSINFGEIITKILSWV